MYLYGYNIILSDIVRVYIVCHSAQCHSTNQPLLTWFNCFAFAFALQNCRTVSLSHVIIYDCVDNISAKKEKQSLSVLYEQSEYI